jgi:hypothetical protein
MLRVEPVDGDVLNFAKPMMEGYVLGDELGWEISLAHHTSVAFDLEEFV